MNSIKRLDLYELVWRKPIKHLAKEWKMQEKVLRKMCLSFDIPLPKSGYWSKVEFGKKVIQKELSQENMLAVS